MNHSAPQTTNHREPKRVPMACTTCRQKKLKCRPLPLSSDIADGGQKRCQRCAEGNLQCIFVPVSSVQSMPTSSTQQQFQFRIDPGSFDSPYNNFPWEEQTDVVLNDPPSKMIDVRGPAQREPPMHEEYPNSSFQSSLAHSSQYLNWHSGYPSQPQNVVLPPGDMSSPCAESMHYHVQNAGPVWHENTTQHQYYPPYDINSYPAHFGGGKSGGPAWK